MKRKSTNRMKRFAKAVVILAAICLTSTALGNAETLYMLQVIDDTYINLDEPDENYGNRYDMLVGDYKSYGLAKFDLSTLSDGITSDDIVKATLKLWVSDIQDDGSIDLHLVEDDWDEVTLTGGDTAPRIDTFEFATADIMVADKYKIVEVDVTDVVMDWVDEVVTNFGIVVLPNDIELAIATKERKRDSNRAKAMEIEVMLIGNTGNAFVEVCGYGGDCSCSTQAIQAIDAKAKSKFQELGLPATDYQYIDHEGGCSRVFQYGVVTWHPDPKVGTHEVHNKIYKHWVNFPKGWQDIGYPISDEKPDTFTTDGRYNKFQHATIYWRPATGAWEIRGSIRNRWENDSTYDVRIRKLLGYPTTDETVGATMWGYSGRYNHFQYGSIYWHPYHGAFEVQGAIKKRYDQLGAEASWLGYPKSGEQKLKSDDEVRFSVFSKGEIYWHSSVGAKETNGRIFKGKFYPPNNWKNANLKSWILKSSLPWYRASVAAVGLDEVNIGYCGQAAIKRYGPVKGSGLWCTEFAARVFKWGGMKNICAFYWLEGLWPYTTCMYDPPRNTSMMYHIFKDRGLWYKRLNVTADTAEVGDYINLNQGKHSAIIVAVSFDRRWIWVAEGNAGNCTAFTRHPYWQNGNLNYKIAGIGKLDGSLF